MDNRVDRDIPVDEHAYTGTPHSPHEPTINGAARETHSERSFYASLEDRLERIYERFQSLVKNEFKLAQTEMGEKAEQVKDGLNYMVVGGIISFVATIFLVLGLVTLASIYIGFWESSLIFSGILALIGVGMIKKGKSDLKAKNLKLERTMRSLDKDYNTIKGGLQ